MNITAELRAWASVEVPYKYGHQLTAIANRIDEGYQKAIRELNSLAGASVLLPVDADGVPIRIGDTLHDDCSNEPCSLFEVEYMQLKKDGWMVVDKAGWCHYPTECRHHHEPTVEDVLREFTHAILNQKADYREQNIAEYAAKFRLANDGKEQ